MPILKTEILGSEIEINYEEVEKERLTKLINQFKKRLSEFPQNGKINNIQSFMGIFIFFEGRNFFSIDSLGKSSPVQNEN